MEDSLRTRHSAHAPDCLVFEIIRNNHAFLKKSGNKRFSLESHNSLGKHSPVYTGFCNKPVLNVSLSSAGNRIFLEERHLKRSRRPLNKSRSVSLTKSKSELARLRDRVRKSRPDLAGVLLVKFAKLIRAKSEDKVE